MLSAVDVTVFLLENAVLIISILRSLQPSRSFSMHLWCLTTSVYAAFT